MGQSLDYKLLWGTVIIPVINNKMSQFEHLDLKGFNQKYFDLEQAKYDQFQNNNGFMSLQRNGQRIYGGPPDGWQGPPPSRGCEVYVTRIPRDCFENELVPIFTKVGPVYEHRLMMEHTGVNRGYGYVRFTNIQVGLGQWVLLNFDKKKQLSNI